MEASRDTNAQIVRYTFFMGAKDKSNHLTACCSRSFLKHGQHPVVTFGEPVGPSDNPTCVIFW